MILVMLVLLSKLVPAKDEASFAVLDKVAGPKLKLAAVAGTLLTLAYVAKTKFAPAFEFSQDLFQLVF